MTGKDSGFWDGGFLYPLKNTVALSDSMLGTVPIYAIWRFVGFSPESSYQLWWICICALNYWISYVVFKKWFKRSDVAVILSWIFAFTIFNIGQLNYMQMIIRFMVPVVFYAVYRMVDTPSVKYLSIYCFGIVFQFYCAMYNGFYLLYFSALFFLIYYIFSKKWKELLYYFSKDNLVYTSIVFIISLAAMLWLFIPYLKMSRLVGLVRYEHIIQNIPLWNTYLFPHESSIPWKFLFSLARPDVTAWWLHYLFAGIIPFTVMIVSPFYLLYNWRKKIKTPVFLKAIIITSLLIVLFHLRIKSGLTLYALIFKFPGINTMRVLIRFMNVEIFLLLIIAGYALMKIDGRYFIIFMALVFADNLFNPEPIPKREKTELIKRKEVVLNELTRYDVGKYKAVALIDTTQETYITHIDMMLAAQSLGIKTVNGYSSNCPWQLEEFFRNNSEKGLNEWLESRQMKKDDILLIKRASGNPYGSGSMEGDQN